MIYTFYSFKGGVGRSMALANVADRLARRGLRVLAIDFDLEAPGLERYYPIDQSTALNNLGLIDLLREFKSALSGRDGPMEQAGFNDLSRFVQPVYPSVGEGGRLDMMTAGCRSAGEGLKRYALDVRTFDWQDFYYNWEGEAFFEWLRKELTGPAWRYDAVLVDSRTGVTEMGGVCAYQLADVVVMMSAANHQNLQGTVDVARDFQSPSVTALRKSRPPLSLLVIPSRIEQRDPALLETFYKRFNHFFAGQLPPALAGLPIERLAIPYEPEYAFEEVVVSGPARREERTDVDAAYERLADALVLLGGEAMQALQPAARASLWPESAHQSGRPGPPETALPQAAAPLNYDPTRHFAGFDAFIARSRDDAQGGLSERLAAALTLRGLGVFVDSSALVAGDELALASAQALHHSRALLLCMGAGGLSPWQKREVELARSAVPPIPVLPVLLPGADAEMLALSISGIGDLHAFDLRGWPEREMEFELLAQQLGATQPLRTAAAATGSASAALAGSSSAADAFNPYAGIEAAGEQHAGLLDLDAELLKALADALATRHRMLLIGPSGSGKTSLIAAGLLPLVRSGALDVAGRTPQIRPLNAWQQAGWLDQVKPPAAGEAPLLWVIEGLDEWAVAMPPAQGAQGAKAAEAARQWSGRVRALLESATAGFRLLLVARQPLPGLEDEPSLGPAERVNLQRRMEIPALRTGMAFEPGLLKRIEADIAASEEPQTLAQLVLPELWARARQGFLTNEAYAAGGGVQAAFAQHACELLARKVPAGHEAAVQAILLDLASSAEGGQPWRARSWRELSSLIGWEESWLPALMWMVRQRLLHMAQRGEEIQFSLIGAVPPESCPPLQELLGDNAQNLRQRDALALAWSRWDEGGRKATALLTGQNLGDARGLLNRWGIHLNHGMAAFVQASVAARRRQRRLALVGGAIVASVFGLFWLLSRSRQTSLEAELNTASAAASAASAAYVQATTDTVRNAADVATLTAGQKAWTVAQTLRGVRVAIQYPAACESAVMQGFATTLGVLGANADKPELVDKPATGSVRYFRAQDKAAAETLRSMLVNFAASKGHQFAPALQDLSRGSRPVSAALVEIWMPELGRLPEEAFVPSTGADVGPFVLVPGACAVLGSDKAEREQTMQLVKRAYFSFLDNDKPRRLAWVAPYFIQRTEVTNASLAAWVKRCSAEPVAAAAAAASGSPAAPACPRDWKPRGKPDEPARFLSHASATAYCASIQGRLPTEDEWEKAARGIDGRIWPWGNEPQADRFLGRANSRMLLAPVGSYPAGNSPYGLSDMAGNLWELTATEWEGGSHVMKGGSYLNDLSYVRASSRWSSGDEDKGADYLGFRCAMDANLP